MHLRVLLLHRLLETSVCSVFQSALLLILCSGLSCILYEFCCRRRSRLGYVYERLPFTSSFRLELCRLSWPFGEAPLEADQGHWNLSDIGKIKGMTTLFRLDSQLLETASHH